MQTQCLHHDRVVPHRNCSIDSSQPSVLGNYTARSALLKSLYVVTFIKLYPIFYAWHQWLKCTHPPLNRLSHWSCITCNSPIMITLNVDQVLWWFDQKFLVNVTKSRVNGTLCTIPLVHWFKLVIYIPIVGNLTGMSSTWDVYTSNRDGSVGAET